MLTEKNTVLEGHVNGLNERLESSAEVASQVEIKNSQQIAMHIGENNRLVAEKDNYVRELSSRDSNIAELNEQLVANNTICDALREELNRLKEECELKLTQSSHSFTEQSETLSGTMGSVTQIFLETYANGCEIHGLICDLNKTILGANFSAISKFEPMTDFNYDDMLLTRNTVTTATNQMLDDVRRIAKKLNDNYKDTNRALNAVSVQCGFHTTPILTASHVINWASNIFSAIRPHESSDTNLYSDVDAYCNIVNNDIGAYNVNIDKLYKNVSSFHEQLAPILEYIESIAS